MGRLKKFHPRELPIWKLGYLYMIIGVYRFFPCILFFQDYVHTVELRENSEFIYF